MIFLEYRYRIVDLSVLFWRATLRALSMILAVFCLVAASAWPAFARPTVLDVRLGIHPDKTRFVMEVTDPIDFRVFALPDPYRVVVDFPEMTRDDSLNQGSGTAGSVLSYRYAPYQAGTIRLVLNVSGPVRVREAFVLPPRDGKQSRFVLDMEPVSPAVFASEMNKVHGTRVAEQPTGAAYTLPIATAAAVVNRTVPKLPEPPMDTVAVTMAPAAAAVVRLRCRRDLAPVRMRMPLPPQPWRPWGRAATTEAAEFEDRRTACHCARSGAWRS